MKKITILFISLILIATAFVAGAESAVAKTIIQGTLTRNINTPSAVANNPVIPGESPTTGLPTDKTDYMPILVQIDNNLGALPQWGIGDADIMYEMPIQGGGWTRFTALFSDTYPHEAGPVRSGRTMHVDLREEWDAAFVHFGQQEAPGSDVREDLRKYGVNQKGLNIDGIGNKYKDYFQRVRYHAAPHNVAVYLENLNVLLKGLNYTFPIRPFLFTDDAAYSGPAAEKITINHKGNPDTASAFVYDQYSNDYQRFTVEGPYIDLMKPEKGLTYANVIIQRSRLTYNNHSLNPVMKEMIGKGAADIFIGGKYIAGVWSRASAQARTVFFDQNGKEIALQRGKTWICAADVDTVVSYEGSAISAINVPVITAEETVEEKIVINTTSDTPKMDTATNYQVQAVTEKPVDDQAGLSTQTPVEATAGTTATVSTTNKGPLNMRRDSKANSEIVTRVPHGSQVEVISSEGDWTHIRFDGQVGFVMTKYLKLSGGN